MLPVLGIASNSICSLVSAYHFASWRKLKLEMNPVIILGITKRKDCRITRVITWCFDKPTILMTPNSNDLLSTDSINRL